MAIMQEPASDMADRDKGRMADLSDYSLVEVVGDDAKSFLFGLTTSDVKQVSPSYSQFSAICDTKGRVIASFIIINRAGAFYLFLPKDMVEQVVRKLRLHVLRAKVTINCSGDQVKLIGLSGLDSTNVLAQYLAIPTPANAPGETVHCGDFSIVRLPGQANPHWLVVGSNDSMTGLWDKLSAKLQTIDQEAWHALDINNGVPFIVPSTSGEYLPQMLNFEAMGGLSFTKGCYPGQEIIARLHYRGKLKRRLYVAHSDTDSLPAAGTQLFHPDSTNCIGHVLSAARQHNGKIILQAVIEIEQHDQGEVVLDKPEGTKLIFVPEN